MNERFLSQRAAALGGGLSLDTEALARYPDLIDLSIGDTDQTTDRAIIDAAFADACAGHTHYGDPQGDPELREAVCRAWREDYGYELRPEDVFVTASSCMGMALVMLTILDPDDEVLLLSPYFSPYRQQIELAGGKAVEVALSGKDGFTLHRETIEAAITPKTKAIILNNPCNPTGAFYDREALGVLAEIAAAHDLLVVADEIYTDYVYAGEFVPFCTLPEMRARTITLNSFSKNFLMTGWRVGYILAEPELLQAMQQLNGAMVYTAPSVSQRAAIHALAQHKEHRDRYIPIYQERVAYAASRIAELSCFEPVDPKGTFYLFPKIRGSITSAAFCQELLQQAHILASPGHLFGAAGEGHVRFACTCDRERLAEAFDRMRELKI